MVLGSRGMVGKAVIRQLKKTSNVSEIIPVCREQIDLTDQRETFAYIKAKSPDWIVVAAARVGGILANSTYPKDFIYENLAIELNVIEGAYRAGVEKLIFLGSSCIYPKVAEQPIKEETLLTGALELTNEPYAIAKIAGIKLCESYNRQCGTDYRSLMPTNLYGPGDNYHLEYSHVIPGLIRRFHDAKLSGNKDLVVWGSGLVYRDFLHVDDLAHAIVHVMALDKTDIEEITSAYCSHFNVGSGKEISISALAELIAATIGIKASFRFDDLKPDGTIRKLLDLSKITALGWYPQISLRMGIANTYEDYLESD